MAFFSGIPSEILSGIYLIYCQYLAFFDILSCICSDILSGISSDVFPGILSDVSSEILCRRGLEEVTLIQVAVRAGGGHCDLELAVRCGVKHSDLEVSA